MAQPGGQVVGQPVGLLVSAHHHHERRRVAQLGAPGGKVGGTCRRRDAQHLGAGRREDRSELAGERGDTPIDAAMSGGGPRG